MNTRNKRIACLVLAGVLLAGCSVPDSGPDPYASSHASGAAKAQPSVTVAGPLVINGYGPRQFQAGVPFHQQPDGSSAIWMKVNKSMDGARAAMYLDGSRLHTMIKGHTMTALVPAPLIAKTGTHMLWMAVKNPDGKTISSNKVEMIAK